MKNYSSSPISAYSSPSDTFALEAHLRAECSRDLERLDMVIAHPRSLARPLPTWRPPSIKLPALPGHGTLRLSLTRHRVGNKVRAHLRAFGEVRRPAYLVTARFSSPDGRAVSTTETDAWLRAALPSEGTYAVHELLGETAPTFCWLVDQHFEPLDSPASLFNWSEKAA